MPGWVASCAKRQSARGRTPLCWSMVGLYAGGMTLGYTIVRMGARSLQHSLYAYSHGGLQQESPCPIGSTVANFDRRADQCLC